MSKILVIDDQMGNLDLLEYLLRSSGHDVVTAVGGKAGLDLVEAIRPDLVVIDLRMPGIDGWEVARRIRRQATLAGIRLLAVSVWPTPSAGLLRDAGFDGFFPMPFEPGDLTQTVDALLTRATPEGP
jgi:CheY-like chemotaxis protein